MLSGKGWSVFAIGAECNRTVLGDMATFFSERVPGPPESDAFRRLTSGLFSMNTDKHKQQRRLMQPAFHKRRIDGYRDDMIAATAAMLDGWKVGETRDLLAEMQRLTFGVAMRTLFGVNPTDATYDLGERILAVINAAMSPATILSPNLPFTPRRRLVALAAGVDRDLRALIEQKRAAEGADVLSTLIHSRTEDGEALTEDELIGQMFLLFFAGHDTTRNTLAWTLMLLAQHPAILADLCAELAPLGGAPTVEQAMRLPVLDGVVKESLRLFPAAPYTMRSTTAAATVAGHDLPAGTEVILSYYHTHRVASVFAEPLRFLPSRWTTLSPSPWEYAPFGGGARVCIGAGFAGLEIRVVLAMLLQRFRPELADDLRIDRHTTIVLSPSPGLPVTLQPAGTPGRKARLRGNVREMLFLD